MAGLLEVRGLQPERDMFVPGSAARIGAMVRQIPLALEEWPAGGHYQSTRTRLLRQIACTRRMT